MRRRRSPGIDFFLAALRFPAAALWFFAVMVLPAPAQDRRRAVNFEEAGRLAVSASAELKNARARRALREGAWALSLRAYLPQVTFTVSEDDRLSTISSDSFTKSYTINVEQLVFDGGRTRASRNVERAELILLADEINQNENALIESAAAAYRQILASRMIIAIRNETLLSLREQRRIMEEELALGMVIPLDLLQADITVREAELELRSLRLQLEETEKQFTELLGLDEMPLLTEQVDIRRSALIPGGEALRRAALGGNPDLQRMVHSIMQRETEAKLASRSWIPTIKATGSYTVSGPRYPLNRQSWTAGFSVNFASPWFNAGTGGTAGWEPPYDRTARVQGSFTPLPDPAAGLNAKQAGLALALERENYERSLERLGREALNAVNNLRLREERRAAALDALALGAEKYRLSETLLSLGRITRIELMEERLEYAARETAAAEAAMALLEAERVLERLTGLPPGALESFCRRNGTNTGTEADNGTDRNR
jgi:outer membrane protein TolC